MKCYRWSKHGNTLSLEIYESSWMEVCSVRRDEADKTLWHICSIYLDMPEDVVHADTFDRAKIECEAKIKDYLNFKIEQYKGDQENE